MYVLSLKLSSNAQSNSMVFCYFQYKQIAKEFHNSIVSSVYKKAKYKPSFDTNTDSNHKLTSQFQHFQNKPVSVFVGTMGRFSCLQALTLDSSVHLKSFPFHKNYTSFVKSKYNYGTTSICNYVAFSA